MQNKSCMLGFLRLFSFAFQDFRLFAFGLGENIAAGEKYDPVKAEECIRKAALKDRYRTMPEGLETYLYRDVSGKGVEKIRRRSAENSHGPGVG